MVGCGVMLSACSATASQPAAAPTTRPLATPRKDLKDLPNFAQVSPHLYRGGQPTAEGFGQLKAMGIKTVVSLRSAHSDRKLLAGTGLRYVRFICKAERPDEENVVKFLKVMEDPQNWPVFVHCHAGADRTGLMVAVYRVIHQGWTAEDAIAELPNFGYHPGYRQMKTYLASFDPQPLRSKVEAAQKPKIGVVK
jgi:protein tyrosine/serine phosphatase